MKKMLKRLIAMFVKRFLAEDSARDKTATAVDKKPAMRVSLDALGSARLTREEATQYTRQTFALPEPMKGVLPPRFTSAIRLAQDSEYSNIINAFAYATINAAFAEGLQFLGYPYLAELTQRPEYRRPCETLAKEMTRKWITVTATGDDDKTDKVKQIEAELKRLKVQELFCTAIEQDGFFGRAQLYLDVGVNMDDAEMLLAPLLDSPRVLRRKSIKRLAVIEPIWTYPNRYNSSDPLDPTFYKPQTWFVMGKEIHASRFLTFVSRPVPDLLKPAYAFGGLSLLQICKPYVDNWLRTRQSVSDLVHSFSVWGLKTNLSTVLEGGAGEELFARAELFNQLRDNRGLNLIDKDTEEFFNLATPLGSLDKLQAQSQEHMSAVTGIPLVKLLGITPSGLNASSDGEIRSFYDWIAAGQTDDLAPNLTRLFNLIQLSLWGEIDPELGFKWNTLWQLDEAAAANARKVEVDTDAVLIDKGIIDPLEARTRIAAQEGSAYASLDLDKEIMPPDQPGEEEAIGQPGEEQHDDAQSSIGKLESTLSKPATVSAPTVTKAGGEDAEFEESAHPRDHGKFATKGGGGGETPKGTSATSARAHLQPTETKDGARVGAGGKALPAHIAKLKIPPAWTDVTYSDDAKAALQATGIDAKGRRQWVYSDAHAMKAAAEKFARISELNKKYEDVMAQNDKARKSKDAKTRDAADAMRLIMTTGIRPGSDADTKADKKAYGATTLTKDHVHVDDNGRVSLRFTGKKGVALDIPITDAQTALLLKRRVSAAGSDGKLFPNIDRKSLLEHSHSLDGGGFKTKDFRTLLGTRTAATEIEKAPMPKTEKEYKAAVKAVATTVAKVLGNTPTVALQSYISPIVFANWKMSHGE